MTGRILLQFLIFFQTTLLVAQSFDQKVDEVKMTIEGKVREGYKTNFDFPAKTIERAWWSYCRDFGRPLNMKGYYRVTIPKEVNNSDVALDLLSISSAVKIGSSFFLALDDTSLPQSKVSTYERQVLGILQRFKQTVYINELNEKLESLEKDAARASKKIRKREGSAKTKALQDLADLEQSMREVREKIEHIYKAY